MKFRDGTNGGGKNILKLKNGETVVGVFRGDPTDFKQHWLNNRSYLCSGDGCEHCQKGLKPSFRFRLNFVLNENGAYTARIFEQGWTVYDHLKALNQDYNLEEYLVKITRNGTGTDTTYAIVPRPNGQLNDAQKKAVSQVPLHALDPLTPVQDDSSAAPEAHEDIPF